MTPLKPFCEVLPESKDARIARLERELEAANTRISDASYWQPIATAPKVRNLILTDGNEVSEGGWITESDQTGEDECGAMAPGWWSVAGIEKPTHWMPLPEAPK